MRRILPLLLTLACTGEATDDTGTPDDTGASDTDLDTDTDDGSETDTDVEDTDCDRVPWYPDADADGYGDDASVVEACDPPEADWIGQGGDCDDTRADAYPGAPETCLDADLDCDGEAGCALGPEDLWSFDSERTQAVVPAVDEDGDGWVELVVLDRWDTTAGEDTGTVVVLESPWHEGLADRPAVAGRTLTTGVAEVDRLSDVFFEPETGPAGADLVWVVRQTLRGNNRTLAGYPLGASPGDDPAATLIVEGRSAPEVLSGDLDDDGTPELLLRDQAVFWSGSAPFAGVASIGDLDRVFEGGDGFGVGGYTELADFDGDGVLDVLLRRAGPDGTCDMDSVVFYGPVSGTRAHSDHDVLIAPDDGVQCVQDHHVGDLDGDGLADVGIVARGDVDGVFLHTDLSTGERHLADDAWASTDLEPRNLAILKRPQGPGVLALEGARLFADLEPGTFTFEDATTTLPGGEFVQPVGDLDGDGVEDLGLRTDRDPDGFTYLFLDGMIDL
jgi:hypothetical protein